MAKIDIFNLPKPVMQTGVVGKKLMFAGTNDLGKSFQSARFPKPLLLAAEAGGSAITCPQIPIDNWSKFCEVVKQLTADSTKAQEVYQTIIVDTVEELVSRCEESVCRRFGVADISLVQSADVKNPNGYSYARNQFKQQVNALSNAGFCVIFITHSEENEVTDPITGETFKKLFPFGYNKEKSSNRFVCNLCDFVFMLVPQGVDPETNKTILSKAICKETNRAFARSRFTQMQTYIEAFTAENVTAAIEEAIKKEAENAGAGLVEFTQVNHNFNRDDYFEMLKPYIAKLAPLYPEYVAKVIAEQLGENRKITSATEDEVAELGAIYDELSDFCCSRGIVVD